jgi:hypothetical protein
LAFLDFGLFAFLAFCTKVDLVYLAINLDNL